MAINVEWHNEAQTILKWDFIGRWNWRELNRALERTAHLLADHERLDAVIYDVSLSGLLPADIVPHLRDVPYKPPQMVSESRKIVIGADEYLQIFWNTFIELLPDTWQVEFAETLDSALTLLENKTYSNNAHRP